nr:hypothetical protein [Tanacetum cinerariifolium]
METEHAQEYYVLPLWSSYTSTVKSSKAKNGDEKPNENTDSKTNEELVDQADQAFLEVLERLKRYEKEATDAAETLRKKFAQSTEDLLLQAGAARSSSTNFVNTATTLSKASDIASGQDRRDNGYEPPDELDYNDICQAASMVESKSGAQRVLIFSHPGKKSGEGTSRDEGEGDEDEGMDYTTNQFDDDVDLRLNEPVTTDEWFIQKEDKDKDEDRSTGSDRGLKKRRTSKGAEPITGLKTKESKSGSSKGGKVADEPKETVTSKCNWFTKPKRPQELTDPNWNK